MSSVPQLRGPKVVAAILGAALDEISEKGYPEMSVESVAERAGVNKTTVYRRWPTKLELTLAALAQLEDGLFADPDTGSLEEDLRIVSRRVTSVLRTKRGRALYMVVLQDAMAGGNLRKSPTSRGDARAIVARGIARGDLPPGTDPVLVTVTLFGAVVQQAIFEKEEPTDAFLRRLTAFVVAGAAADAEARARSRATRRAPRSR